MTNQLCCHICQAKTEYDIPEEHNSAEWDYTCPFCVCALLELAKNEDLNNIRIVRHLFPNELPAGFSVLTTGNHSNIPHGSTLKGVSVENVGTELKSEAELEKSDLDPSFNVQRELYQDIITILKTAYEKDKSRSPESNNTNSSPE